jgi:hypothetical protein
MGLVMSAFVIPFPAKWADACSSAKTKKVLGGSRKQRPQIEAQVERITALLTELEDLLPPAADLAAVLTQARATIRQVKQRSDSPGVPTVKDEGDSQPHIDREALEHHFQFRD